MPIDIEQRGKKGNWNIADRQDYSYQYFLLPLPYVWPQNLYLVECTVNIFVRPDRIYEAEEVPDESHGFMPTSPSSLTPAPSTQAQSSDA